MTEEQAQQAVAWALSQGASWDDPHAIVDKARQYLNDQGITYVAFSADYLRLMANLPPEEVLVTRWGNLPILAESYGVVADGATDDTAALQAALNAAKDARGGWLLLPPGNIRVDSPLDCTEHGPGLVVQGHGERTVILANTGGVLFDLTGSTSCRFRDFRTESNTAATSNKSTIHFLCARSTTRTIGAYHAFDGVGISVHHDPTANGGHGTFGVYNLSSELWKAHNLIVKADKPLVFLNANLFEIASPFRELQSGMSMTMVSLTGSCEISAGYGPAITFGGASSVQVDNAYLTQRADNPYRYAVDVLDIVRSARLTVNIEGFSRVLRSEAVLYNLDLRANVYPEENEPLVFLDGDSAILVGADISVLPNPPAPAHYLIASAATENYMQNVRANLFANQGISFAGRHATGLHLVAQDDEPAIAITSPTMTGVLVSGSGVSHLGGT